MVSIALAAALLAGWWLRGDRSAGAEQWTGTWLGGPSPAEFPRVSPDGQTLAFCTLVDGLTQVAIMKPESANWTVLTRDRSHGLATMTSWSADGARLFYDRWFGDTPSIFSVPALGGEERLVLDGASVFAVGREQSISGSMGVDADGFARGTITTVTLAVTRDEARQLAEARRTGELDILLMPRTAQVAQP